VCGRKKEGEGGGKQESQPPHLQRLIRHQQCWDDKRFTGHSNALFVCSIMAKWRLPWISWPPSHSLWLRPYLKRRTIWPPGSTDQADTLHLESVRFEVACLGRIDSSWWVRESCTEGGSRPAYNMQAPVELAILEDDSKANQMSFGLYLYTAFSRRIPYHYWPPSFQIRVRGRDQHQISKISSHQTRSRVSKGTFILFRA
jgi:hypothetical protein